jgi:hypothetical protein
MVLSNQSILFTKARFLTNFMQRKRKKKPHTQFSSIIESLNLYKKHLQVTNLTTNLKAFSTKIALQHLNDRCTFSVTYCIKNFFDLTSMIYLHLEKVSLIGYTQTSTNTNSSKKYNREKNLAHQKLPQWDGTLQAHPA